MKYFVTILLTFFMFTFSAVSFADPGQKFQSGIKDVLTSPFQVTENVKQETTNAKFLPFALVGGLLKGSFYMAKKIVTGTLMVVTSPLDMIHK